MDEAAKLEDAKTKITEAINLFVNNNKNLIQGGLEAGREKIMKVSNKAREDARPTFAEWSKQNPGKTMKDYRREYGI